MTNSVQRPSEVIDGEVDTDVSAFRDTKYPIYFNVREGVMCHQCRSGEVYQPLQTLDLPMVLSCLKCGSTDPASEFEGVGR